MKYFIKNHIEFVIVVVLFILFIVIASFANYKTNQCRQNAKTALEFLQCDIKAPKDL